MGKWLSRSKYILVRWTTIGWDLSQSEKSLENTLVATGRTKTAFIMRHAWRPRGWKLGRRYLFEQHCPFPMICLPKIKLAY